MQQDPKTAVMASTDGTEPSLVSRANLSTLPWGPLENAVLFLKEGDFAQVLAMSKEFSTLHSDDFWRERCCDTFGQHLTNIEVFQLDNVHRLRTVASWTLFVSAAKPFVFRLYLVFRR